MRAPDLAFNRESEGKFRITVFTDEGIAFVKDILFNKFDPTSERKDIELVYSQEREMMEVARLLDRMALRKLHVASTTPAITEGMRSRSSAEPLYARVMTAKEWDDFDQYVRKHLSDAKDFPTPTRSMELVQVVMIERTYEDAESDTVPSRIEQVYAHPDCAGMLVERLREWIENNVHAAIRPLFNVYHQAELSLILPGTDVVYTSGDEPLPEEMLLDMISSSAEDVVSEMLAFQGVPTQDGS